MTFKLGRLSIQNFKAVKNSLYLDLNGCRAVILDGPNGFGKTTIFDALEICFTGKIERISTAGLSSNAKAREGHFLKNDFTKPTVIKLELISDATQEALVIKAKIRADIVGTAASVKKYGEHVQRLIASRWDSEDWTNVSHEILEKKLALTNIASLFNVQHYISQEDTSHFLRNNDETERHKTLSHLFGTSAEAADRDYFEKAKGKISVKMMARATTLASLKAELRSFSTPEDADSKSVRPAPSGIISAVPKLEQESLNRQTIEGILEALEGLSPAVADIKTYQSLRLNNLFDTLTNSRDAELDALLKFGCSDNFGDLKRIDRAKLSVERRLSRLQQFRESQRRIAEDDGELSDQLLRHLASFYDKSKKFAQLQADLAKYRAASSSYSRIIQRINTHRTSLLSAYVDHCGDRATGDIKCPMCGTDKNDIEQLLSEYQSQEHFFVSESSSTDAAVNELRAQLQVNFVAPVLVRVEKRIDQLSFLEAEPLTRFFKEKSLEETSFLNMARIKSWLDQNNIDYRDLLDQKLLTLSENYRDRKAALKQRIQAQRRAIPLSTTVNLEEIKRSCKILEVAFNDELGGVSEASLGLDIEYTKFVLRFFGGKEAERLSKAIQKEDHSIKLMNEKIKSVDDILKAYSDNIKKYEIEVASCIAIPFYIYTSKVLQTRPDGSGVFLKTPPQGGKEKNPYIRFCARRSDSHDAWCTMSSGQLAGLVISFALAMNRLYPSKLGSIFIDDPIQAMDEINMASLIQLFLHEFPEHQFFVSTHERDISSYMSYKFLQSGKKIERVNMREIAYV